MAGTNAQSTANPQANPRPQRKRVSFADNQPTTCPHKQVRFTSDTKPGSQGRRRSQSASSDKTRLPSPTRTRTSRDKADRPSPGLSSVKRDFEKRRPPPRPSKSARPSEDKPDEEVSIPAKGESYRGTPRARDRRKGYEWVSYEVKVTATGKRWLGK